MVPDEKDGNKRLAEAVNGLVSFLDGVDATRDTHTQMTMVANLETSSAQAFARRIEQFAEPDEHWSLATIIVGDGSRRGIAAPTTDIGPDTEQFFAFVEVHQLMVAWWLTTAWRTRELVDAWRLLAQGNLLIPAAACSRSLVETAAQFRADAIKIGSAWHKVKESTDPARVNETSLAGRLNLREVLYEVVLGGKFDDKVPDLPISGFATWCIRPSATSSPSQLPPFATHLARTSMCGSPDDH
jgi:hypothetical protein